ncbi:MAG: hypothetical protein JNL32_11885 [Candidatus Kapabacteria bacterium]|nr:hypothetical protein [Candidatus Kapabacteria bacterium]
MPSGTVYWTSWRQAGKDWRIEIFSGAPAATFSSDDCIKEQLDREAIELSDSQLNVRSGKYIVGLKEASQMKIKLDVGKIPSDLRGYITNPQSGFTYGVINVSTVWILRSYNEAAADWNIDFCGAQRPVLLDEWSPDESDLIDIEVQDIRYDILEQISFEDLNVYLTDSYAANSTTAGTNRFPTTFAADYYVKDGTTYSGSFYKPADDTQTWLQFYSLQYVFDSIGVLMNRVLQWDTYYNLDAYLPRSFFIGYPTYHWIFYKQSYSKNGTLGDTISVLSPDGLWIMLYLTIGSSPNDFRNVADGYFAGASSVAKKFEGKGIAEWLDKVWQGFLAKDQGNDWNRINAAPLYGNSAWRNESDSSASFTPMTQLTIPDAGIFNRKIRRNEQYIAEAVCVPLLQPSGAFSDNYSTSTPGSKTAQSQEFGIAIHNMPSMADADIVHGQYGSGDFVHFRYIRSIPLGVLFYKESTATIMSPHTNPYTPSEFMVRVHSYAYCVLDWTKFIALGSDHGTTKELQESFITPYTDVLENGEWDIVAAREQGKHCMPLHLSRAYLRIFGNVGVVNLEYDLDTDDVNANGDIINVFIELRHSRLLYVTPAHFKKYDELYPSWTTGKHLVQELTWDFSTSTHNIKAISYSYSGA